MGEATEKLREMVALASKKVWVAPYVKTNIHGDLIKVDGHWKTVKTDGAPKTTAQKNVAAKVADVAIAGPVTYAQSSDAVKGAYAKIKNHLPTQYGQGPVPKAEHRDRTYRERVEAMGAQDAKAAVVGAIATLNAMKKNPADDINKSDKITFGRERGRLEDVLEMMEIAQALTGPDPDLEDLDARLGKLNDRVGHHKFTKVHGKDAPHDLTDHWIEMKVFRGDLGLEKKIGKLPSGKAWGEASVTEKRELAAKEVGYAGGLVTEKDLEKWRDFYYEHPQAKTKHGTFSSLKTVEQAAWQKVKTENALAAVAAKVHESNASKAAKAAAAVQQTDEPDVPATAPSLVDAMLGDGPPKGMAWQYESTKTGAALTFDPKSGDYWSEGGAWWEPDDVSHLIDQGTVVPVPSGQTVVAPDSSTPKAKNLPYGTTGQIDPKGLPGDMPVLVHNPNYQHTWVLQWNAEVGEYEKYTETGETFPAGEVLASLENGALEPLHPVLWEPGLSGGTTWAWDPESGAYQDVSEKSFDAYNGYAVMLDKDADGKVMVPPPPGMAVRYADSGLDEADAWEWHPTGVYVSIEGGDATPEKMAELVEKGHAHPTGKVPIPLEGQGQPQAPSQQLKVPEGQTLNYLQITGSTDDPSGPHPYAGNAPDQVKFWFQGKSMGSYVKNEEGTYDAWVDDQEVPEKLDNPPMTLAEVAKAHEDAIAGAEVEIEVVYAPENEPPSLAPEEDPGTTPPYGGTKPLEVMTYDGDGNPLEAWVLQENGSYSGYDMEWNSAVGTFEKATHPSQAGWSVEDIASTHKAELGEGGKAQVTKPASSEIAAAVGAGPVTSFKYFATYTVMSQDGTTEITWDPDADAYAMTQPDGTTFSLEKTELEDYILEAVGTGADVWPGDEGLPPPKVPNAKSTSDINGWLKDRDANYLGKMTAEDKATWATLHAAGYAQGHFNLEVAAAAKGKKGVEHKDWGSNPLSPGTKQGQTSLAALKEKLVATPEGRLLLAAGAAGTANKDPLTVGEQWKLLQSLDMHEGLLRYRAEDGDIQGVPTPDLSPDMTPDPITGYPQGFTLPQVTAIRQRFDAIVANTRFDLMPPSLEEKKVAWAELPLGKASLPDGRTAFLGKGEFAAVSAEGTSYMLFLNSGGVQRAELWTKPQDPTAPWHLATFTPEDGVTYENLMKIPAENPEGWNVTTPTDPWKPPEVSDETWKLVTAAEVDTNYAMVAELAPPLHDAMLGLHGSTNKAEVREAVGKALGVNPDDLSPGQVALAGVTSKVKAQFALEGMFDGDEMAKWVDLGDTQALIMKSLVAVAESKTQIPATFRRRATFSTAGGQSVKMEWRPGDRAFDDGEGGWHISRGTAWPTQEWIHVTAEGNLEAGTALPYWSQSTPIAPTKVEAFPSVKTWDDLKTAVPQVSPGLWNALELTEGMDAEGLGKVFDMKTTPNPDSVFQALNTSAQASGKPPLVSAGFMESAPKNAKYLMTHLLGSQQAESSADIAALNWLGASGHWSGGGNLPEGVDWSASWLAKYAKGESTAEQINQTWTLGEKHAAWMQLDIQSNYDVDYGVSYHYPSGAAMIAQAIEDAMSGTGPGAPTVPDVSTPVAPKGPSWGVPLDLTKTNKKLGGMHSKTVWTDQFDREWMSKGFPSDPNSKARVDAEHWAMELGRLHGFNQPESRTMTLDGQYSYLQHLAPKKSDMQGVVSPWSELDEDVLVQAVAEHVNDWTVSNHDTHHENLLVSPDGKIIGIDKGQAFKFLGTPGEKLYSVEGGKVVAWFPPGNGARVWYDRVYADVAAGKVDKDTLRKVTSAVLTRAKRVSKGKDNAHREMLEQAFKNRTDFPSGMTREEFIEAAMDRKADVFDDFVDLWKDAWKTGGYDWDIDESKLGVGVLRNPKNEDETVFAGVSGELLEAASKSKSKGVPTFFSGTDLEDSHMILWEEVDAEDGTRILMGEGKLRADADAAVTKFLKGQDVAVDKSTPAPSAAPPDPLPGNNEWSAKVVAFAKTVNVHSPAGGKTPDGAYNETTVNNAKELTKVLTAVKESLGGAQEEGKVFAPSASFSQTLPGFPKPESLHQQQAYIDSATHYLEQLEQITEAMDGGVKTPVKSYAKFDYTPPPPNPVLKVWTGEAGEKLELKQDGTASITHPDGVIQDGTNIAQALESSDDPLPGWQEVNEHTAQAAGKELKIVLTSAFREAGNFNPKTGVLSQTSGKVTTGNPGQEYDITYGDVEIEYRPWHGMGVPKSQQGTLRFKIKNWSGEEGQLQDMFDVLSQMGVELSAAEETDLELFYWRHLNGILHSRSLSSKHSTGKQKIDAWYASNPDPSPEEEIAALRDGFAAIHGAAKIDAADYFPKVQQVDGDGNRGGKPYWLRPDAKTAKEWLTEQKSSHFVSHAFYNLPEHWEMILGTGGLLATDERLRVLGQAVGGTSSFNGDQQKGAGSFLFTNPGTTKKPSWGTGAGHVILNPALHNRTSNYAWNNDNWGNVDLKASQASYDIDTMSNATQEMMVKNFISFLAFMEVMVVSNAALRKQIIARMKELGIEEIRGVPVEEIIVSDSEKNTALSKARERILKTELGNWKG